MKKTTAKTKVNKVKSTDKFITPEVGLEETEPEEAHAASELDPDVLKVLVKPKKQKNIVDTTDYVPELERGDTDDGFESDSSGYQSN